ncbi:hypothetical protein MPER_10068 [Moniliophthora perniciosa FA553]|nr:hypothetical protein MPER_10068 [Moniliophthora perniciosa FA553]
MASDTTMAQHNFVDYRLYPGGPGNGAFRGSNLFGDLVVVFEVGRLLYALRLAIAELKEYYSTVAKPTIAPGQVPPRFCPSITSFINSNGQTAGTFVVAKFVHSYCAAAHTSMAERGFAPRLIHHAPLGPKYEDLALVVMDYVEGDTLDVIYPTGVPDDVRQAIRGALDILAEGNFIFGDLQKQNIMLTKSDGDESVEKRLRFIDFDWACREGDGVRYPVHLSNVFRSLSGAEDFDVIERKHQESMFEKLNVFICNFIIWKMKL